MKKLLMCGLLLAIGAASLSAQIIKPQEFFNACAAGLLLILSPWPYDGTKRHISRADCVALNRMAEEICHCLNGDGK